MQSIGNRKKIFVVDDEEANLKCFKKILSEKYDVIISDNSNNCIPIIKTYMPDIILLDVQMPGINGFELYKQLLSDDETKNIPIIFVSSLKDSEHVKFGLDLGAVDFISKPINKIETLARIKTHLKISQLQKDLTASNKKLEKLLKEKAKRLEEEKTQKNKIQNALIESERKFQTIFMNAPEAIIIVSVESGEIIDANPASCELFGYSYDELIGLNQIDLLQPSSEKIQKNYFKIQEKNKSTSNVRMSLNTLIRKNGEKIPVKNSSRTILIEGELYLFGIIFDLSGHIKVEEELRQAKEHAEELNRLKGFFLQNLSHELRTPLVGMLGFSNILEEELDNENFKYMARAITTSGKRLLNTLTVLVDFSVLKSNRQKPKWDNINLNNIIIDVVNSYQEAYNERGLTVNVEIPQNEVIIKADDLFITEVLSQLMNNAITYTHYGSISISLETEEADDKTFAVISIKDTGIGISEDKLNSIFEDFRQISEGCSREYEGLGLGLALVKEIVDLHNGEIMVESKENEGTLFKLKLEIEKEKQKKILTDYFFKNHLYPKL